MSLINKLKLLIAVCLGLLLIVSLTGSKDYKVDAPLTEPSVNGLLVYCNERGARDIGLAIDCKRVLIKKNSEEVWISP